MKVLHTTKTRLSFSHVGLVAHVPPGGYSGFQVTKKGIFGLNFNFSIFLGRKILASIFLGSLI